MKWNYPVARKSNVVDLYHGIAIPDPYRWLEDPDSEESRAWIHAQNKLTFQFLEESSLRNQIRQNVTELWNFEKFGIPHREGSRYFYLKNDGLQNQSVLYVLEWIGTEPRVLLDPNLLSPDGTVALAGYSITDDGKLLAYGLSTAGSDWMEWKVRDIDTGHDLEDHLKWIKFSGVSWTRHGKGFYYSRYDEPSGDQSLEQPNYYNKLFYHRLGSQQSEDQLIYERPDQKEWHFNGSVTEDGRYLVISVWKGTGPVNLVFYKELPDGDVQELISEFRFEYSLIQNEGSLFWFLTTENAPRRKIVSIDLAEPDAIKTIVPESEDTLEGATLFSNQFLCMYLRHAHSIVKAFSMKGEFLKDVSLPGIGTIAGFNGKRNDRETFYLYTGFNTPGTIYRYNIPGNESTTYQKPHLKFDPDQYATDQIFYKSKDGTAIPMFLSYKKGIRLNQTNPAYLYGYGGFNISLTPAFSVGALEWMKMGGIYAVANLRGGGEYGEEWHQAGTKDRKQNVFDDFIAAAEWLIRERYTTSDRLAIGGGSNGGLLVAACMVQRPDLFGAVLASVGVFDMLRFHKFTIGWAWVDDYGSPDNEKDFPSLYAYSPLHHLKSGAAYPAVFITTADHDDRVVPAHSFKFAAALQDAQGGDAPILIRIEVKAGHGAGKPTSKLIDELTDKWTFLTRVLRWD